MTRGAVLGAALLLWPSLAGAQDLETDVLELLRTQGCAMDAGALAEVFGVMGRDPDEIGAAVEALVDSGSATLVAGRVTLSPGLCRPDPGPQRVPPLPWVEERLALSPDCSLSLAELAREADAAGIVAGALDSVVGALGSLGRIIVEDGAVRLRPDLCRPGAGRDRALDRVLSLGRDSFRAVLGMMALETDCRIPLDDPETLVRDLGIVARRVLLLGDDLSEEAAGALARRVREALEDPGPAFREEGGALVARYCLP